MSGFTFSVKEIFNPGIPSRSLVVLWLSLGRLYALPAEADEAGALFDVSRATCLHQVSLFFRT